MRTRIDVYAEEIQLGDVLPGGMVVAEITHGYLPNQILFRDATATASSCYWNRDRILIEREAAKPVTRGKTGRNLQAEALIEIMLKKGLIERLEVSVFDELLYRITPKGKAYVHHLETEAAQ